MKKCVKRVLSLFISILMIFGSIWLTPVKTSAADFNLQKLQTSQANSTYQEKDLSGMPVVDNKNFTSDKTQITAKPSTEQFSLSNEEATYVNKLADSMQTPLGAVGFTDLGSSDIQSVIVQFNVLPSRILNIYNKLHSIKGINSDTTAAAALSQFKTALKNAGISVKFGYDFHDVFNGVAVTLPTNLIEKVAKLPGVYSVSPDYMMYAADDSNGYVDFNGVGMQESRQVLRTAELNDMGFDGKGIKVGVLDTGIDYNHPDLKDNYKGGHDYIGAAVAKVDSSGNVSYIVPVSEDNDPMETTYKDWQAAAAVNGTTLCPEVSTKGSEYYTSHGSHVSGTVAADGQNTSTPFNTLGIAPKADLYVYRVLGPYGSGPSSGIIAAINRSVIDGMKVINLSLGANQDTAYGADVFALNNACIAGTIVCVSAGNNAEPNNVPPRIGLSLGTPGTAYLPITVAASNYGGGATTFYMDALANSPSNVKAAVPFNVVGRDVTNVFGDNQITAANLNYVEGLGYQYTLVVGPMTGTVPGPTQLAQLQALADNSLKGQILVVKRGALTFTDIPPQAKRLGAGATLIINKDTEEGFISNITIGGEKMNHLPVLTTTHQAGDMLAASYNAAVASSVPAYIQIGNMSKEQLAKTPAGFSSIGPVTETAGIKPDIIAPGVDIMSTQPAFITNPDHNGTDYTYAYARMSGTSMSCPHMTGISVLMRQAFPNASVAEIKARLMNTADPTLITSGVPATPQASVFEVGAGFVNPYRTIVTDTSTYVTVQDDIPGQKSGEVIANQTLSSLSFGTIKPSTTTTVNSKTLPVTVHNTSVNDQTYHITGVYNDQTGYSRSSADGVTISFTSTDVTVPAGQTETFGIYTTVPVNCPKGYYEGYVHVTLNNGNDYVLPFAFATGDAPKPFTIDDAWVIKPVITANTGTNIRCTAYSNSTPFALAYEGDYPGGAMDVLLLDLNDTPIGYFGTYTGMGKGDGTAKLYSGAITYQCYSIDQEGNIGTRQIIPAGAYHIAFADTDYYYPFGGLVVDNQSPVLTFNPSPSFEYSNGATTVHITGRIWSHAGQLLVDNKITSDNIVGSPLIGQELNGLVIGSTIYQYCDNDGYFDIPLTPSAASKTGIQTSAAYAQDYYATTYYTLLGSLYSTKTGNNRTIGTVNINYTQSPILSAVTATNSTADAKLSYNPRLIAPVANDFKVQYSVNGGTFTDLTTTSFNYTAATATASFTFAPFPIQSNEQRIVVGVSYKGGAAVKAAAFVVNASQFTTVTATNGSVVASLVPAPADGATYPFMVTYSINGGAPVDLGTAIYNDLYGIATLDFTPFSAQADDQSIVISVTYKGVTLSAEPFDVPAAKLVGLTGDNGSLTATLDAVPADGTSYPFAASYTINGGDRQSFGNAIYNNDGTATLNFTPFERSPIVQHVTVYVNYKGIELSYSFDLEAAMGTLVLDYKLYQDKSVSANEFTTDGMKFFQTGNFYKCTKINVAEAKTEGGYRGFLMAGPHGDQIGTFTAKIDEQNKLTFTYNLFDGLKTTDTVSFVYSPTLFTSKNEGQLFKDYAKAIQTQTKGASTGTFIVDNVTGTEFYVYLRGANSSGTMKALVPPDPKKVITLQLMNDLTPQMLTFTYGTTLTQVVPTGTYTLSGYGTVVVTLDDVTYVEYNIK